MKIPSSHYFWTDPYTSTSDCSLVSHTNTVIWTQAVEVAEEGRNHLRSEPRAAQRGRPLRLLQLATHQDVPARRPAEERRPVC